MSGSVERMGEVVSDICHYCHEGITRHAAVSKVMDDDGVRTYHDDCHRLDILAHRERGERLPEDQELTV